MKTTFDFVVVGAGVFGAWTARHIRRSGASVAVVDADGPGNSRSSSGGETRILRMGYGADELYTRWAIRSFPQWCEFFESTGENLFARTGVLWLGLDSDPHLLGMQRLLTCYNVPCERLEVPEISRRYPQLKMPDVSLGILEPGSGVALARRAMQALARDLERSGVAMIRGVVKPQQGGGKLEQVRVFQAQGNQSLSAGCFVFACGAWLPAIFPGALAGKIFPTRQEVFFLEPPTGSDQFAPGRMPAWLHHSHPDRPYALPDIESQGFKIALDRHGPEFDPDQGSRIVPAESVDRLREYLREHVPELAHAPVIETRVCQYENTWNGDFLIDRHPGFENVWLAGGGSGHGFKHGPAVGEYLAAMILASASASASASGSGKAAPEPRFSLSSKQARQMRGVY